MTRTPALVVSTLLASAAFPHSAGAADEPAWAVQEVVVTAPRLGPVLWRVRKGQSEVWIVGVLPAMPRTQTWNTARLERILDGANVLLTRPKARAGLGDIWGIIRTAGLPKPRTLDQLLAPADKARLDAAAALARRKPDRYQHLKPVWAGWTLLNDYEHATGLTQGEPEATVVRLARRHHVPEHPIGVYKAGDVLKNLEALTPEQSVGCVTDALGDVEQLDAHAAKAGAAWAKGDIKTAVANYARPSIDACLEQSGSYRTLAAKAVDDTVHAIDEALTKPGKSVAVFSLEVLLSRDGALEKLRAQGVEVAAPEL